MKQEMKAVFLDCKDINSGDLSWEPIERLCSLTCWESTPIEKLSERIGDSEIIFIDSAPITHQIMSNHPNLKYIGIAATGFNHVDLDAAAKLGIAVTNVPGYSTTAVAQHTISLLLHITNKVGYYQEGMPLTLLEGKSLGIIGYGNIGRQVARIAKALGMTVNIYSQNPQAAIKSHVVSLHCPLFDSNRNIINDAFIGQMRDGAILINTARGGLVDENALAKALKSGKLTAAGLDVTATEPPSADCPLLDLPNCFITPHIAFTPVETRESLLKTCAENLNSFLKGEKLNRLV